TVVDLQDIFRRFSFDNICSIVLGFDPKSLPNKLIEFTDVLFENAFKIQCCPKMFVEAPNWTREDL
ncbi:hypothetical protein PIB30_081539, partial [Stylosanthes scabra]|nr:hypothetical protein [Stylosanthes scabra]